MNDDISPLLEFIERCGPEVQGRGLNGLEAESGEISSFITLAKMRILPALAEKDAFLGKTLTGERK